MIIAKTIRIKAVSLDPKKTLAYLIFLILLIWICGYGAFLLHIHTLTPEQPDRKTDAVIVLTGGNLRIGTGLELYANGMAPQLFISGVHNLVKDEEIKSMWNGSQNLPECCIIMGRDATTTIGNAQEVYKWIKTNDIKTIRLVTSAYHMPRAMLEFTSAFEDLQVEIITHPVKDKSTKRYFSLIFNEYNKIIFRWSILVIGWQR